MTRTGIFSVLTLIAFLLFFPFPSHAVDPAGTVTWVYDGDTLEIDGIGTVRLIGIDTPEKEDSPRDEYYRKKGISLETLRAVSKEALRFNIRHVKGERVSLSFDREKKDRHGRTLAYVYLPDGRMLNRLLIEEGLAAVYRKFDFAFKDDFLSAEAIARNLHHGLWKDLPLPRP